MTLKAGAGVEGPRWAELVFPAPAIPLSINDYARLHWSGRRRKLDCWRDEVSVEAKRHGLPRLELGPSRVEVVLPFARNTRRDPHNYTSTVVKSVVDGLVLAGVWPDDTAAWVSVADPVLVVQPAAARPFNQPFGLVRIRIVETAPRPVVPTQEALI